jgi:hypothetical protein
VKTFTWWGKKLENGTARIAARKRLHHSQSDPDLAGVRDKHALARLLETRPLTLRSWRGGGPPRAPPGPQSKRAYHDPYSGDARSAAAGFLTGTPQPLSRRRVWQLQFALPTRVRTVHGIHAARTANGNGSAV